MTMSMSTMRFLIEIMFILKAIKYHFKGSYDKQNLTLVDISYEVYETDIGIRSDIPLTAAYSDLCNRFSRGKLMTSGAGAIHRSLFGKGHCFI